MGEPVWALAAYFPEQGAWREDEYLKFSAQHPRVEFSDGRIEVPPVPTDRHQAVLDALMAVLRTYARRVGGRARSAGLRLRLRAGRYREPDLVFLSAARLHLKGEEFWSGADLVMEVVSGSVEDRERDTVLKRREYAEAGIAESWIVDPEAETITVLALEGGARYLEHAVFGRDTAVRSPGFAGLECTVDEVLDAD